MLPWYNLYLTVIYCTAAMILSLLWAARNKFLCRTHADVIAKATGCKASYSLMKLPHHDPLTQTVPDAMHTVKEVLEHLFRIIVGKDDNEKVEMQLGRRFDSSSSSTALG